MSVMLQRMLRIRPQEVSFAHRQFHCGRRWARERLEHVGETFLRGYHAALACNNVDSLVAYLEEIEQEFRGFAYEGASMALDILDQLMPWKRSRLDELRMGPGQPHIYMVHVGVGWSLARLPFKLVRRLGNLDALLCWLALDGYGFHQGYFHWPQYARGQRPLETLGGYGLRAFDQGLGRSLWFVSGGDADLIVRNLRSFPAARLGDLWSGIGLACAYAGGADRADLERIRLAVQEHYACLAQGAVFAAKARERGGNPAGHTELACNVFCSLRASEAAALSDRMLSDEEAGGEPAYEIWRRRIQMYFLCAGQHGREDRQIAKRVE